MPMLLMTLIFYILSAVLVLASLLVTLSSRSVPAVLWLIVAFVATAGLWILIQAEFLGLILIVVYVGAVMTLFLFVVMMLNLEQEGVRKFSLKTGIAFGALFVVMMLMLFLVFLLPVADNASLVHTTVEQTLAQFGQVLLEQDACAIECAGIILCVAMVGAIYLTHRVHTQRKQQNIAQQQAVTKKDRLRIVSL